MKKPTAIVSALAVIALTIALIYRGETRTIPQPQVTETAHVVFYIDTTDSYQPFIKDAVDAVKSTISHLKPGTLVTISTIGADAGTKFLELEHPIASHGKMKYIDYEEMDKQRISKELDTLLNVPAPHLTDILAKLNDDTMPRGNETSVLLYTDARQCDKDGCMEGQKFKIYSLRPIKPLQQSHIYFVGVAREGLSGSDWDKLQEQWRNYIKENGGILEGFTEAM